LCGINGIFAYRDRAPLPKESECLTVRAAMRERGPDGEGFYRDDLGRCLLGHRRLAIIDLSEAGAQPMMIAGRTITFNGEIYNYEVLREELEGAGVRFRTASDTEVLLQLFLRDGPAMVQRLRGMFAFALWDSNSKSLLLARDPHGVKPLYYADDGSCFRFASSVRALRKGGGFSSNLDPAAILGFLGWGSVPEPLTMYRAVRTLPAGSTLLVTPDGLRGPERYWSVPDLYSEPASSADETDDDLVRQNLLDSVRAHLVADVPVGVFLSSGIDSSVLLGLASEVHPEPVYAVTLSFNEFKGTPQDEAPLAREVALQYGARHSVVELSAATVRSSMQDFLSAMDQPTVDGLNVYWVSKAVRETGLKAALSGLGGDELFGGYNSFRIYPRLRRLAIARGIPGFTQGAKLISQLGSTRREGKFRSLGSALTSRASTFQLVRGLFTPHEIQQLVHPELWENGHGASAIMWPVESLLKNKELDPRREVAVAEQCIYMRNQLLRDADWASMKHGLEVRVPLVDRQLSEALAVRLTFSGRKGKGLLAQSLRKALPDSVLHRGKTGFALPMQQWVSEEISASIVSSLPSRLLHPDAGKVIKQLQFGVTRSTVHWSRVWALHCLARWIDTQS
jgi:asparagine synthase (glutamine-hydrolysing)